MFYYEPRYFFLTDYLMKDNREQERDFPLTSSLIKWLQCLGLDQAKARSLIWVSLVGAGSKDLDYFPLLSKLCYHGDGLKV